MKKAKRSRQSRATDITEKVRRRVRERDGGCVFCKMGMEAPYLCGNFEIMHYINRSRGGLGIEENLAVGCSYHHGRMDNGAEGRQMRERLEEYLKGIYPDWENVNKTYSKWN